jgi:outer membrane murein-binding lipoprotein Lpp
MTKYLILSCALVFTVVSLAGCASDEKQTSTAPSPAATMAPDSKAMTH